MSLRSHTDQLDVVLPVTFLEMGESLIHEFILLYLEFDLHVLRNQVSHQQKGFFRKSTVQFLAYFWETVNRLQKFVRFGKLAFASCCIFDNIGHSQLTSELWLFSTQLRVDYIQDSQTNDDTSVHIDLFVRLGLRHLSN
jgi:hypothetical protein